MVSVVICTRNRADDLRQTLESLSQVVVKPEWHCELLVADNGSTDDTARVIDEAKRTLNCFESVRSVWVSTPGKSHAYNAALAEARGEAILCTDDDVRLPTHWIEGMAGPILRREADAVAGGVRIAEHLQRPWMTPIHRAFLASTERLGNEIPVDLIGANMAFSKRVLQHVAAFDPELGAGALGFCEETLFSWQLREAGYTITNCLHIEVEHHPHASRLARESYLEAVRRLARTEAYIAHHWEHRSAECGAYQLWRTATRLALRRLIRRSARPPEGLPMWEILALKDYHFVRAIRRELRRPRRYDYRGLTLRGQ